MPIVLDQKMTSKNMFDEELELNDSGDNEPFGDDDHIEYEQKIDNTPEICRGCWFVKGCHQKEPFDNGNGDTCDANEAEVRVENEGDRAFGIFLENRAHPRNQIEDDDMDSEMMR